MNIIITLIHEQKFQEKSNIDYFPKQLFILNFVPQTLPQIIQNIKS